MTIQTIIEPFRIKTVEPLRMTTRGEREQILAKAGHNLFNVRAEDVLIDLLTDSGTSAMSARQWAGLIDGDESYAGARSFYRFEKAVKDLTGLKHIIPTHQGRAAEKILFTILGGPGKIIPNNTHFDTTRANIEVSGAEAADLPVKEALIPSLVKDFKGNMDIAGLERLLKQTGPEQVPLVMMTVTNNSCAGQPVSMGCIRRVSELCHSYGIPFFIDACRFAENAWFVKTREPGCRGRSVTQLAQEMFSYADGCIMSGK
ncbi:partial tryptophanase, partial [uncultured bacterium]